MHLKIAPYWHPHCHHYSFHRPYQQCGAHSVGGQSSRFHGAFLASPSTPTSPYPPHTLFSIPVLHLSSLIFPSCVPRSLPPPPPLSLSACLLGSTYEWHPPQCGEKEMREETRAHPRGELLSWQNRPTQTEDAMTSTIPNNRWNKAAGENGKSGGIMKQHRDE